MVLCTAPAQGQVAATLARALIGERLCACVNIVPTVRSIYEWQGEVQDDTEQLLIIKTTTDRLEALTTRLVELHPYSVPEVIALPIEHGFAGYLDWVTAQTRAREV